MSQQSDAKLLEPMHTAQEIAGELRTSTSTVTRRCLAGEFPGAFKAGREWRIPASARIAYLRRIGAIPSEEHQAATEPTSAVLPMDEAPASPASAVSPTAAEAPTPTAA